MSSLRRTSSSASVPSFSSVSSHRSDRSTNEMPKRNSNTDSVERNSTQDQTSTSNTNSRNTASSNGIKRDSQSATLFHSNEKGTKKQKRCDHDSDDCSYNGLSFHDRRKALLSSSKTVASTVVDFDRQGIKTWGERLLFETLEEPEIDELVGLATFFGVERNAKGGEVKPTLGTEEKNHDSNNEEHTLSTAATRRVFHDPKRFNPLLSASYDSPLPPSHIGYIQSRRTLVQNSRNGTDTTKGRTGRKSTLLDSAATATGLYLEEALTAALLPLAGLHVLRCRALEAMESGENEFGAMPTSTIHNPGNNPSYALQPTALHPITGEHVQMDMTNRIRWREEKSFVEWTLPPEEAIVKLIEQGMLSKEMAYHFVPEACRSWTPRTTVVGTTTNSNDNDNDSDNDDRMAVLAKRFDADPRVVRANQEIFNVFLAKEERHAASWMENERCKANSSE
mmetsp:Transcript_23187/g.64263  ORF Transcript_23187/g.64263 Transcript_23187/m.64263 type:complete len:451 (-) Transcript_23187:2131-3483(-)